MADRTTVDPAAAAAALAAEAAKQAPTRVSQAKLAQVKVSIPLQDMVCVRSQATVVKPIENQPLPSWPVASCS